VDPISAFRIAVDGLTAPLPGVPQTLPQPFFPGVGANAPATGDSKLDPSVKPARIDQVDFTIQREVSSKTKIEFGYIGMRSHGDQMFYNLDSVPYMTTLNGQNFAQAYANLYTEVSANQAIQPQPFFESAMGGPSSPYCTGFANCTAAVASKQRTNLLTTQFYNLWAALNAAPGWTSRPYHAQLESNPVYGAFHGQGLGLVELQRGVPLAENGGLARCDGHLESHLQPLPGHRRSSAVGVDGADRSLESSVQLRNQPI